ncbi:MAG: type III-B CRISPR-associated protein Cas10/Cmr2 [candidate division WOR-3 bacterium]|jgi:CRISPR-associated protein Cmr2
MADYKLKLKALLHDPIDKQYVMWELKKDHEEVAEEYFRKLIAESLKDERIEEADHLASAISRIIVAPKFANKTSEDNFKKEASPKPEEIKFIDPFSLKVKDYGKPSNESEVFQFFEELSKCTFRDQDERAELYFLFLWRFLPEVFTWVNTHPADSRAPNHSVYDHLVQTSAIVSTLPNPAFLLFTIGPVQEFISTARKASDLWAGSYILSYLTYKAIEVILEELGPDNVIYPNLLRNPLVDRWIYGKVKDTEIVEKFKDKEWFKKFIDNAYSEEFLTIANFPNRFLAIVPFDKAKEIADRCKNKIEEEFDSWTEKLGEIGALQDSRITDKIKNAIKSHLKNYFQIYYVYLPWFISNYKDVQTILDEYKNLVGENEVYKAIKIINEFPYYKPADGEGKPASNVGSAYSLLFELTERFLASRKMYKNFGDIEEQTKEKCHLCGNYDVLDINWGSLEKGIVKENEKLCGVCFIKRVFPKILANILEIEEVKFPSTSEMATVMFKVRLDEKSAEEFIDKFKKFREKAKDIPLIKSVPALKYLHKNKKEDEESLYTIDGQWFFESSYREDYLIKEYGIDKNDLAKAENEISKILEFLKKLSKPPTYYAILLMDGDKIGEWLNGEKMPEVEKLLHPKTKNALLKYSEGEDKKRLQELLCLKHPISASIHQNFSRRLTEFALSKVRKIVEDEHYGKLIYAGGDDLLAFLPTEKVLDCAYELQKTFKETISDSASMSAGIVIVHHKYPLRLALDKLRDAEKKAKNIYNRNSFYITYISRSGEERSFGGNWKMKKFFGNLICLFRNEKISKGFGYEFLEVIEKLNNLELIKLELKRILKRKFSKNISYEERKRHEEEFLNTLEEYKEGKLKDFANFIIISEKLS